MGDVGQWKPYPIIPLPSQSLATHCYRELALPSSGANPSQKKHRCQPQVLFRYTELNSDPRGRQAKDYGQRAIFSASFGHWFCLARVLNLHSSRYFQLLPMTVAHDFKALKMSDAVGIPMTTLQHTPSWAQARPDSSRKMSAQWWQRKQQNLAMPATASVLSTPPWTDWGIKQPAKAVQKSCVFRLHGGFPEGFPEHGKSSLVHGVLCWG